MYRVSVSRGDWRREGSEIGVENGIFSLFFSFFFLLFYSSQNFWFAGWLVIGFIIDNAVAVRVVGVFPIRYDR